MIKKCSLCDEEFEAVTGNQKICKKVHMKPCVICGKEFAPKSTFRFHETRACSKKCGGILADTPERTLKMRATSLERYGTETPQQSEVVKKKTEETNKKKYGVAYPNQSKDFREKAYKTNIERYGVKHPLQNKELKEKARATLKKNFGVEHPSQSRELRDRLEEQNRVKWGVNHTWQAEEVKEKIKQTIQARYGVDYPSQNEVIQEKIQNSFSENARNGKHNGGSRISKINREWREKLDLAFPTANFQLEKGLKGRAFDLVSEEFKILLELNPTRSHSSHFNFYCLRNGCELPCENHEPMAKNYHETKARVAQESGYSLIQVYDWDSEEKIINLLRGKLERGWRKHSARKLRLRKISQKEANVFLGRYHIQGGAKQQTHCYGLFTKDDSLIAVATFGKARFKAKADFEWIRYAVAQGHIVHGGPHRMLKVFTAELPQTNDGYSIVSYVDYNHTTAPQVFLETAGFQELKPTGPQLMWSKGDKKIYNNSLLALGADRLLKTSYGKPSECGLNNEQIMLLEGWLPVYTAGNRIFKWESKIN